MNDTSKQGGTGLLRGLELIEAVVRADRPLSASDLIELLGQPKATVYRLCGILEREGVLVRQMGGSRYVAGPRLTELARSVFSSREERVQRHAVLKRLSMEIGETCNITVNDGAEMIYVDRVEAEWPLRTQFPIGSRVPLHCTASGKLFLASLPPRRCRQVLDSLLLDRRTPNTRTDIVALEADLKRIREIQLGTDEEEFIEGMAAVAVPIVDDQGRLCATLAVHAPVVRLSFEAMQKHVPRLRQAAADLGGQDKASGIAGAGRQPTRR
jgi:DNA-binding IclR family transcriptional regulator